MVVGSNPTQATTFFRQNTSMKIKLYNGRNSAEGAELALKHHLYVHGWCLFLELRLMMAAENPNGCIALCFVDDIPVAIAVITSYNQVMAFCKEEHRRKGYCTALVQRVDEAIGEPIYAQNGIDGSDIFWRSLAIDIEE